MCLVYVCTYVVNTIKSTYTYIKESLWKIVQLRKKVIKKLTSDIQSMEVCIRERGTVLNQRGT